MNWTWFSSGGESLPLKNKNARSSIRTRQLSPRGAPRAATAACKASASVRREPVSFRQNRYIRSFEKITFPSESLTQIPAGSRSSACLTLLSEGFDRCSRSSSQISAPSISRESTIEPRYRAAGRRIRLSGSLQRTGRESARICRGRDTKTANGRKQRRSGRAVRSRRGIENRSRSVTRRTPTCSMSRISTRANAPSARRSLRIDARSVMLHHLRTRRLIRAARPLRRRGRAAASGASGPGACSPPSAEADPP